MLTRRLIAQGLLFLAAFAPLGMAQRNEKMDPDILNYKLSMDKIRAFDGVIKRMFAESKTDASLRSSFKNYQDLKTLGEMTKAVESNPKMIALIKAGGLTARDFCIIPMGVMAAGGAYMVQTQYKKDVSSLATPENVAFYGTNKAEIEKITNSWSQQSPE